MAKHRAFVYVDGLNLYYGICQANRKDLLWINLYELIKWKINRSERLVAIKYFNTKPKSPEDKVDRHIQWVNLLGNLSDQFEVVQGRFIKMPHKCRKCAKWYKEPKEKLTDVNIASHLIFDAFDDKFETAYIVSGDGDLTPAIQLTRERFPKKVITGMFPPNRQYPEMGKVCSYTKNISIQDLQRFVLPDEFELNGRQYYRPHNWRKCK